MGGIACVGCLTWLSESLDGRRIIGKMIRRMNVVFALLALSGCAGESDEAALAPTTAESSSTSSAPTTPEREPELVVQTEVIEPLDTTKFLEGIQVRRPELLGELTEAELVEFGLISCELRNGYVTGSRPDPTSLLADKLRGVLVGVNPDRAASAISNAADTSFCDSTIVASP